MRRLLWGGGVNVEAGGLSGDLDIYVTAKLVEILLAPENKDYLISFVNIRDRYPIQSDPDAGADF